MNRAHRSRSDRTRPRRKANITPLPRNVVEFPGASAGEEYMSWGPNYDWPPIIATNWWPVHRGKFLGTVTLRIPHWRCRIYNCRVMRWGPHGLRVFLPQQQWYSRETDKFYYWDIFGFLTDEDERDFYEAALRAVRALVRRGEADPEIAALVAARATDPGPDVPF